MPLKPGAPVGTSIAELINSYKQKGTIGNITPKSKKKAIQIAAAISYKNRAKGK